MASEGFHELAEQLSTETKDMHRAIKSLMEELEAVDWYQQRVDAATNQELKEILAHNRDEEKEHACMILEWIRRRDAVLDEQLHKYLFTADPIVGREEEAKGENGSSAGSAPAFSIGSLKGTGGAR